VLAALDEGRLGALLVGGVGEPVELNPAAFAQKWRGVTTTEGASRTRYA